MARSLLSVYAVVAAWSLTAVAFAADLLVPSTEYPTIQAAIDAAVDGDTVLVAAGSYNERLDMKGKAITLRGVNGYTQTILDPLGGTGQLLVAQTGETHATVIDGLSFRNSPTGGVRVVSAALTIQNCRFLGNSAAQGPALWMQTGDVILDNTQFVSNVASDRGGAIYCKEGSVLRLNGCTLTGNKSTGTRGGAIYAEATTIDFDGTHFNSNREEAGDESYGGAIFLLTCGGTMDDCSFSGNTAASSLKSYGGSLYFDGSSPTLRNCGFTNCYAFTSRGGTNNPDSEAHGGSIYLVNGASPIAWDCTWSGCKCESTGSFGGGLCSDNSSGLRARGGAVFARDSCNFQVYRGVFLSCMARAAGSGSTYLGCGSYRNAFVNCYAYGGAIWVKRASPYLEDCTLNACVSQDAATGVQNGFGSYGGAIWTEDLASPTMLRTRFTNNSSRYGGAMFMTGQSSPFISDCSYIGNNGTIQGGVMYSEHSIPNFAGTLFQDNTSPSGSVAYSTSTASNYPSIGTSVFCGNLGTDMVGNWYNDPGNVQLEECVEDCNGNGTNDRWDILLGLELDCNGNLTPDSCDITANPAIDCNEDGIPDSCQSADPGFGDCDGNGVVDSCEPDCNGNGLADVCEIRDGVALDCNMNGIPDSCDLVNGRASDCDGNGVPDSCQADCNGDGIPDACEIAGGGTDCNGNGVPDACEMDSDDANNDGILDSCQQVDFTGIETQIKPIIDLNTGVPTGAVCWRVYATFKTPGASVQGIFGDSMDVLSITAEGGFFQSAAGGDTADQMLCTSSDPSLPYDSFLTIGGECFESVSIAQIGFDFTAFNSGGGITSDNAILYALPGTGLEMAGKDGRVLLMQLTTNTGVKPSGVFNLIGDNAAAGVDNEWYAFGMTIPDPVLVDCNGNGTHDAIDISTGAESDCNFDGIPDSCQFANPDADCDGDGTPDICEITSGTEEDLNNNWIPDSCECLGDATGDGAVNVDDIIAIIAAWGDPNPGAADLDGDGVVGGSDLALVLQGWGSCL